jgi:hypothetical protein
MISSIKRLKPRGIIEEMYVADITHLAWKILRLRRCKVRTINVAFRGALGRLLEQLLKEAGAHSFAVREQAESLALAWFSDPAAKKQVSQLLRNFQLDETAIEDDAGRYLTDKLGQLEVTGIAGVPRNKVLRCVGSIAAACATAAREQRWDH